MSYFKIGDNDYSAYVNELEINKSNNYTSQTNAAGDTVVDYINSKRTIKVGIIPLNDAEMLKLQLDIDKFNVPISFRDPLTNELAENVNCIIPSSKVEYYTIRIGKVTYKGFSLSFTEL